jgi:hypothetical protein
VSSFSQGRLQLARTSEQANTARDASEMRAGMIQDLEAYSKYSSDQISCISFLYLAMVHQVI